MTPINYPSEIEKIQSFIQTTFKTTRKSTAIIGLSGGVDSATSFALTTKALGSENVQAVYIPSKFSHPLHLQHINQLISQFQFPNSNFHIVPIKGIIQKIWKGINHQKTNHLSTFPSPRLSQLRLANISARIRMITLFDFAKRYNGLVVGTENYSEHLLGYYTRFGDEASDLEPIRHLYKSQVWELAKNLMIPEPIISKAPSADLWIGQADESELGFSYLDADPILADLDQGKSIDEIISSGKSKDLVTAVFNQVESVKFKHQVPYKLP